MGHPVLEANLFANNSGAGGGGAMHLWRCEATVRNNVIRENFSGEHSGGISLQECNGTTVEKNLILSNSTPNFGGGVTMSGSENTILVNNTIINNAAGAGGGGVCIWYSDSTLLLNNIVVGSSAGYGVYSYASSNSVIEYNDVWNNLPADYDGVTPGEGCISADPLFCDPENDNYYLYNTSPCVGTGQGGVDIGALGVGCSMDYAVLVTAGEDRSGFVNTPVQVTFHVQNIGQVIDTYDLSISDSLGWELNPTYSQMTLDPDQKDSIIISVPIPDVPIDTKDKITLTATSQVEPLATDSDWLSVTVIPLCGDVDLSSTVDIADVVYLINYLFFGGPPPCEP